MQEGLELLSHLEQEDVNWIFENGEEQQVIANAVIITEGEHPDYIFFVLEGLLAVTIKSIEDQRVATMGPGEILGEISFLKQVPASASVVAVENSLLLAISQERLKAQIESDFSFAAHFYRALALESAHRLRNSSQSVGRFYTQRVEAEGITNQTWEELQKDLLAFKNLIQKADHEALKADGVVPEPIEKQIHQGFEAFVIKLNEQIGDDASGNAYFKEELGRRVQREFLPYLLLTQITERMYSKPRGYAGDFLSIEMMYRGVDRSGHRIGMILDNCFLRQPAAKAVQNRRSLMSDEINKILAVNGEKTTRVTSMACGPAAELFDAFEGLDNKTRLKATLIDIDLQALAFVGEKRDKMKLTRQMEMINGNLVYLATGRQQVMIAPQDLVYSIGLIDYFNDKFVLTLLNYVYEILKPGGVVILGNFHPRNCSKALMDHVLDWRLTHRTEEDLNRLYRASKFGHDSERIRFENEGVNLFAVCKKDL